MSHFVFPSLHGSQELLVPEYYTGLTSTRSHGNVGRILYRVDTLRNIADDLLRTLMIKSLIRYS